MTLLRTLRQLILGETWVLPLGVAALVLASVAVRALAPDAWEDAGGFLLLAGVIALLGLALRHR